MDVLISDAALKAIEEAVRSALEKHGILKSQVQAAGLNAEEAALHRCQSHLFLRTNGQRPGSQGGIIHAWPWQTWTRRPPHFS
jgi:hypothetical protein